MKIRTIEYSMTRQVTNFHPASFSISADVAEGEDPEVVAKEIQRLAIRILYKDRPIERDSLIKQLVEAVPVEKIIEPPVKKTEVKQSLNKTDKTIDDEFVGFDGF